MYYRKKIGRGFTYRDEQGQIIKDKKLKEWFKSLIIPPAWRDVEINGKKSADLLVTGRDEKNRKQYIYHPKYIECQNSGKFDRMIVFAEKLEYVRHVTGQHLRKRKPTREKVMATMLRLLEFAFFRPGNEAYSKENPSIV